MTLSKIDVKRRKESDPVQKMALDSTRWASWGDSECHRRAFERATDKAEVWEAKASLVSVVGQ